MSGERGFTLVECLAALALALVVLAACASLTTEARQVAAAQLGWADVTQRARMMFFTLAADAENAGRSVGGGKRVVRWIPAVWPRRLGPLDTDADDRAYGDRVSLLSFAGRDVLALSQPFTGGATVVQFDVTTACGVGSARCGFDTGSEAIVVDATGRFEFFRVADAVDGRLVPVAPGPQRSYQLEGLPAVAAVDLDQYSFDPVRRQLRWSNGFSADLPVADDVVGFSVRYFGDTRAPRSPRPPLGLSNCLYDEYGSHVDEAAASVAPTLAEISLRELADGPFCGVAPNRFDRDLLRIRLIRMRLRVQVSQASLRGRDTRFAVVGHADGPANVPDVEWTLEVAPPNLR